MKTFDKVLLLRVHNVNESQNSTVIARAKMTSYLDGDPVDVMPAIWDDETEPSHYAYVLRKLERAVVKDLEKFVGDVAETGLTLLSLHEGDALENVISSVGLKLA